MSKRKSLIDYQRELQQDDNYAVKLQNQLEEDIKVLCKGFGCKDSSRMAYTTALTRILQFSRIDSEKMRHFEVLAKSYFDDDEPSSLMASLNLIPGYEELNSHTKRLDKFKKDTGKNVTVKTLMDWEDRSIKQLVKYIVGLLKDDFFEDTIKYGAHTLCEDALIPLPSPKYRVIHLDDDYFVARDYQDALHETGDFDCYITESVRELLTKTRSEEYDAHILDVRMRDVSQYFGAGETHDGWITGLLTFQKIREIKPDAVVVALSNMEATAAPSWFTSDDHLLYCSKEEHPPQKFASVLISYLEKINAEDFVPSATLTEGWDNSK